MEAHKIVNASWLTSRSWSFVSIRGSVVRGCCCSPQLFRQRRTSPWLAAFLPPSAFSLAVPQHSITPFLHCIPLWFAFPITPALQYSIVFTRLLRSVPAFLSLPPSSLAVPQPSALIPCSSPSLQYSNTPFLPPPSALLPHPSSLSPQPSALIPCGSPLCFQGLRATYPSVKCPISTGVRTSCTR